MVEETPQQRWRKKNLPHVREYERQRYATRPEIRRSKKNSNIKRKYGISMDEFDSLLESQHQGCAICQIGITGLKDAHIDHDHKTGKVRGILCNSCNNGLGRFRDNQELLKYAINYLAYNGGQDSSENPEEDYRGMD